MQDPTTGISRSELLAARMREERKAKEERRAARKAANAAMTPDQKAAAREANKQRVKKYRKRREEERDREAAMERERNNPAAVIARNRAERPDEFARYEQLAGEHEFTIAEMRRVIAEIQEGKPLFPDDEYAVDLFVNAEGYVEHGFRDGILVPHEWVEEWTWARECAIRIKRGQHIYEFGMPDFRVPRDLYLQYLEVVGTWLTGTNNTSEEAQRLISKMRKPIQPTEKGAMRMCSCGDFESQVYLRDSLWAEYAEEQIQYRCWKCQQRDKRDVGVQAIKGGRYER
jgi:hypothetical protein